MLYPTSYDVAADIFGDPQELIVLTLAASLAQGGTTATFNETSLVAQLVAPGYLTFEKEELDGDFEIVKYTGSPGSGQLTIQRGSLGTTDMDHLTGSSPYDRAIQDPVSEHFAQLRALLFATEKFQGLVGTKANLPATCVVGESYIATDTQEFFRAVATNTWRLVNRSDHGAYTGLDADDHTSYHTDSRAAAWHSALTGAHIQNAETHIHDGTSDDGDPVARFRHGLLANLPATPSALGELYYAEDISDLYFAKSDLSGWDRYCVMPVGTLIYFETSCPNGWSRKAALDGKMLRGAPAGSWNNFTHGSGSHRHGYFTVISHIHSIDQQYVYFDAAGAHDHWFQAAAGSGGNGYPFESGSTYAQWECHAAGTHYHTAVFPIHYTETHGDAVAYTNYTSAQPPYRKLVLCEKT